MYNWEFNVLGIYNFNNAGPYKNLFDFIKNNHNKLDGDILEAGVFKGSTLLSMALFLKKIKSNKKIYGFDTFQGFPKLNNKYDNINQFKKLLIENKINVSHYKKIKKFVQLKKKIIKNKISFDSVSSSEDFSKVDINLLMKKIKYLDLDNIVLVKGPFNKTMKSEIKPKKIMAAFIDCDLYDSYMQSLNFIWPKLVFNGLVQMDEYFSLKFPGARIACDEFFKGKKYHKKKYLIKKDDFERWCFKKK